MDDLTERVFAAYRDYRAAHEYPPNDLQLAEWMSLADDMDLPYHEVKQALDELADMGLLKRGQWTQEHA